MKMRAVLYNLRSIHNAASCFRTADGVGVEKLYLVGTTPTPRDRFGDGRPAFEKVSLGAENQVPYEYFEDGEEAFKKLRKEGFEIVAVEQDKRAEDVFEFKVIEEKLALVFGPEVEGLPRGVLGQCDAVVEIPMRGKKESLNVSVAFGVATYVLSQR